MTDEAKLRDYLRRVTIELGETRRRLQEQEGHQHEPIAIVGMACTMPGGVTSPQELWELVANGRDATGDFPADRGWDVEAIYDPDPDVPGTTSTRRGGFLDDITGFDAGFFGMSPRLALATDPQHRLFLESCWSAMEDGGLDPEGLAGSDTGVYAATMYNDYAQRFLGAHPPQVEGNLLASNAQSVLAGRVAYTYDLGGPTMTVDTACSSSLVTIHLAVRALRGRETSLALAGGVSLMATPESFIEFSRQRALSPDGRCRSFSAGACGAAWSEGAGVVLLERLSDALANGRRIHAIIRGSAVNQDGRSNGMTAPSGPAQERVIRAALRDSGLESRDIDLVEAHGTGTTLGDPIEARALIATYGRRPADLPVRIGSVKSNLGHTQAAAGVAGVIKVVQALRHEVMPPSLFADDPTTHVDWDEHPVELLERDQPWPRQERVRRAGVSAFGISGTNAHLILQEPPVGGSTPTASHDGALIWPLSARTESSLRAQAGRIRQHLDQHAAAPVEVARTLAGRTRFSERAALVGRTTEELHAALTDLAQGAESVAVRTGQADARPIVAFVCTGQGGQRAGMGQELHAAHPVFAARFDEACAAVERHLDRPLRPIMWAAEGTAEADLLQRTEFTQPALLVHQVAMLALLESVGLSPDLMAGHSVGEIAAAVHAGVLTLEDAARLVTARGRMMQELDEPGAMVAVAASREEVEPLLETEPKVALAAVNGPAGVVVSGAEVDCLRLAEQWRGDGRRVRRLKVSHAFHSPLMAPMVEPFARVLDEIEFGAPDRAVVPAVAGDLSWSDRDYWVEHVGATVEFAAAVQALSARGATVFVEIGPDMVLSDMVQTALKDPVTVTPTARRGHEETKSLAGAIAQAWACGAEIDWDAWQGGGQGADLPTYAFDRQSYWLAGRARADVAAHGLQDTGQPLFTVAVDTADGGLLMTGRVDDDVDWVSDHVIGQQVMLAGAALTDALTEAGSRVGTPHVAEVTFETPVIVAPGGVQVQLVVGPPDADGRSARVFARGDEAEEWSCAASARLTADRTAPPDADWATAWPPGGAPVEVAEAYEQLRDVGIDYGPSFRLVTKAWQDGEDLYAELVLPFDESEGRAHPAAVDAMVHAAALGTVGGPLRLPFAFRGVRYGAAAPRELRVRARAGGGSLEVHAAAPDGGSVLSIDQVQVRAVDPAALRGTAAAAYVCELAPVPDAETTDAQRWVALEARETTLPAVTDPDALPPDTTGAVLRVAGETPRETVAQVLPILQRWAAVEDGPMLVLWCDGPTDDPSLGAVTGLVRTAVSEHPGRFAVVHTPDGEPDWSVVEAAVTGGATEVVVRDGVACAPRIGRARLQGEAPDLTEGTVLVTGGTGGLGAAVARHLVAEHGVRHLALVSRRGGSAPAAEELATELRCAGAEPQLLACDVGDRSAVAALIAQLSLERPLVGVVHTAGVLDDALLAQQSPESVGRVLAPKADGATHLDELTRDLPLRAFVLFSSVAGLLGNPGQANYAAANAAVDAIATRRHAAGLPAVSIAWGAWTGVGGMAAELDEIGLARLARAGLSPLSEADGLAVLDAALAGNAPVVVGAGWDRRALQRNADAGALPNLLRGLVRAPAAAVAGGRASGRADLVAQLADHGPEDGRQLVLDLVRRHVANVLVHDSPDAVQTDRAFQQMGFDSLAAVELRNQLSASTGLALPPTIAFDHPTVGALVEHVYTELAPATPTPEGLVQDLLADLEGDLVADDTARARVLQVLGTYADRWGADRSSGPGEPRQTTDVESASDEEIFALIEG